MTLTVILINKLDRLPLKGDTFVGSRSCHLLLLATDSNNSDGQKMKSTQDDELTTHPRTPNCNLEAQKQDQISIYVHLQKNK